MHLRLMHHPSTCINEWRPTASTLCPLDLPRKRTHKVSRSCAQEDTQNDHPQILSYIQVAVLNATLLEIY